MNFKSIFLGLALIGNASAFGAEIRSGSLNAAKDAIVLTVRYGGGCEEHIFTLQVGGCFETFPVQCTAQLLDDPNGDFCEAIKTKTIELPLKKYKLNDSYYSGGKLTIKGDNNSSVAITLPTVGQQPAQPPVSVGNDDVNSAYRDTIVKGPARLLKNFQAGDMKATRSTAEALYFVWEAISQDSPLFSEEMYKKNCSGGMVWACRNISQSGDALTTLHRSFNSLSLDQIKKLVQTVYNTSLQE